MKKIEFQNLENNNMDYEIKEAYNTLRTNLKFCGTDKKVIAVTSSIPGEGKSSITFNLSKSLAEDGKKVLFIDADLRKSVLLGRYKVKGAKYGLSQYLSGQNLLDEVLYQTNINNLDVIFSGPSTPIPSELLDNDKFRELIENARDKYDYIIIDTPPLGSVIDAAIISKIADGILLTIEYNKISYKFAQTVKQQLEKSKCEILGVILNKVDNKSDKYYGEYYGK